MLQTLKVNAGHDLTVENLETLTDRVHNIAEVSIGHGITAEALVRGFSAAVRRYLNVLSV